MRGEDDLVLMNLSGCSRCDVLIVSIGKNTNNLMFNNAIALTISSLLFFLRINFLLFNKKKKINNRIKSIRPTIILVSSKIN